LLGAWEGAVAGDRDRVAEVFGKSYAEVEAVLESWTRASDPLVRRDRDIWRTVTREEAWRWLSPYLNSNVFERFGSAAKAVLSELDPKYDRDSTEWYLANPNGAVPLHSRRLHKGMAETLCLLALRTEEGDAADAAKAVVWRTIRDVLARANDWRLWASIGSQVWRVEAV
jgi:hypothetical protein